MRRFGQFIRHAGHFGKSNDHLNAVHQIGKRFIARSKDCFRDRENSCPILGKENEMFSNEKDLNSRHLVAIVFAFLSGVSAVSTAVLPAVLHI
jgi:hypothetical protein